MNMNLQNFQVSKAFLSFALTLDLGIIFFLPIQASAALSRVSQQEELRPGVVMVAEYIPPRGLGAPPAAGGATRSGSCPAVKENKGPLLTALMPVSAETQLGLTVAAYPQFFVYVPETSAQTAEFVLKDENENDVYRTTFPISSQAGITSVSLPKTVAPLEIGKNYHWYVSIVCNPKNRRHDAFVDGWTRRIELSATLASELEKATPRDRADLYGKAGIWHEAISTLAQLRGEAPNDAKLAAEWKKLLESAGLKQIADLPITLSVSQGYPKGK
jgi:hypothetical protein